MVNAATETGKRMYGDVDQNGRVDLSDLITMCQYAIKDIEFNEETLQVADVTKDGEVNVGDIALLKQYLMGDSIPIIGSLLESEETTREVTTVSETTIEETSITEVSETSAETTVTEVKSESISETTVETTVTEVTSENISESSLITTEDTTMSSDVTTVTTPVTTTTTTPITTKITTTTHVTTTTKPQTTTTAPPVTTTVQTTPVDTSNWSLTISEIQEIAKMVNDIRNKNGVASLEVDLRLCNVANARVDEISKGYTSLRPDGSKFTTIFDEYGISYFPRGEVYGIDMMSRSDFISSIASYKVLNRDYFKYIGIARKGSDWSILFGG